MAYHVANERHVFTLSLGEGAFTALRVLAHCFGHPTAADYILDSTISATAGLLPQICEKEILTLLQRVHLKERVKQRAR